MPEAAELYNAMNPWTGRGDDKFYLDLVLAADAVLDVGCGTGTLLSKARAAGHRGRLVGVDPDALTPGGRFVFETRNPLAREWERWPEGGFSFMWEGKPVRVYYEVQPIVGDVVDVVENIVGDGWRRADHGRLRFLSAERLGELVAEAGLVLEEQYGDWNRGPLTADSAEIISVVSAQQIQG